MSALVDLAERHLDWPMPGYTHLQRAQPVYLSHHLLAYFWKFRRDLQRFKFCMTATDDLPLGAGALAGVNFDTEPDVRGAGAGLRRDRRELARRGLQPRLRARLPLRRGHVRHPPVPAGWRDRGVVEPGVRLLRGGRPVRVGLEPHAPEEEPRRRGAAAGQGAPGGRPAAHAPRRAARAPAHLQQGPAGGQGAALRRDRHASSCASAWRPRCWRHRLRPRPAGRRGLGRDAGRHRRRRPARQARRPVPRGARDRGRRGPRGGRPRQAAVGAHRGRARRARAAARRRRSTSCCATGAWLESKVSEGGTALPRVRDQLAQARHMLAEARAERRPLAPRRRLLRTPRPRRGTRPGGMHRPPRRHRGTDRRDRGLPRDRARLPRLRGTHRPHASPLRAARPAYVYRSYGSPRAAERGHRGGGGGGGGADPGARAARRAGAHARAPRPRRRRDLCSGPGKLTQALGIGSTSTAPALDGPIEILARPEAPSGPRVAIGERIGINRAVELPWRFCDASSTCVSRPWPTAMRRPRRRAA